MAFERDYRYCWSDGVTEVTLDFEAGGAIIIAPNVSDDRVGQSTYFSMIDSGGSHLDAVLSREALDQLIAELQRARCGCFYGEWPRRVIEDAVLFDQDAEDEVDTDRAALGEYCESCQGPCQWPEYGETLLDEFTSAWSPNNDCELCAPEACDECEVCVPPDPELERLLAEEEEIERAARLGRFVDRALSDDDRKAIIDGLFDRLFGELV